MLQGYADEHVSDAIVGALQARGMDVVSVAQLGRQGTDDAILLDQALTEIFEEARKIREADRRKTRPSATKRRKPAP